MNFNPRTRKVYSMVKDKGVLSDKAPSLSSLKPLIPVSNNVNSHQLLQWFRVVE